MMEDKNGSILVISCSLKETDSYLARNDKELRSCINMIQTRFMYSNNSSLHQKKYFQFLIFYLFHSGTKND